MGKSKTVTIDLNSFDYISEGLDLYDTPKGEIFNISLNPYNGLAIIEFNTHPLAYLILVRLMIQSNYFQDMFPDGIVIDLVKRYFSDDLQDYVGDFNDQ